jgi:cytochrome c oxidase subunit 3
MDEPDWRPVAEPVLLWANTAILIFASIAYHWTRNAAINGVQERLKPGLTIAGTLTMLFLLGQLVAWQQLNAAGYYLDSNIANAFFYLLTAVHGLHMLGGMWVWARSTMKVWTGADADSVRLSIELCTVYWHFLLLVWIVLFGMLLST